MKDTFKPNMVNYGKRTKLRIRLYYLVVTILLITPFTNWLIPLVKRFIKGNIVFYF